MPVCAHDVCVRVGVCVFELARANPNNGGVPTSSKFVSCSASQLPVIGKQLAPDDGGVCVCVCGGFWESDLEACGRKKSEGWEDKGGGGRWRNREGE